MNLITTNALTMSSQEIADLVGSRHDNVRTTIQRLAARSVIQLPAMQEVSNHLGQGVATYLFAGEKGKRDSLVVVAQLSPEFTGAIVDRWQELERQAGRPMTQAELIAASANQLVAIERQQAAHQVALERVEHRVEELSQTMVWDHCPQNCLSLTGIKATMLARHGLSGSVVDYVLKEWPHQPNSAGMVRNGHEDAKGSQYLVWTKSLVTAAFKRFVDECEMVNATQATHPYFNGRFRLTGKVHP
ncbi:Rha family transcriptional regulator [Pseudomonas juntendi]|jgi:phage regulator Rha-like protein|uniref:Rha family transcriptional regulator n=1 Tax=Pseudomonas juntendi TaxID=2666183 RepID=UPI0021B179E3|nr:Rha family transcriptional regulator [Pseudomonas juntendi]UXA38078.1 Rha family transcriptional regulator [Pseudomonas juntendi]